MGPHWIAVRIVSEGEMRDACVLTGLHEKREQEPPWGLCDFTNYTLYVTKAGKKFPKHLQMHAFWHEYFHMLLHCAARDRLSRDETLVDTCGALQLQAFDSAEF